jgi:hypothetical protein
VECKEEGCTKEARYANPRWCTKHYEHDRLKNSLDKMHVRPCAGECGKRVHNAKYVIVPGVTQGHGPEMAWCNGCYVKYKPKAEPKSPLRGDCKRCKRTMSTKPTEGFVRFQAKGMCCTCYDFWNVKKRSIGRVYKRNPAKPKLSSGEVLAIRRKVAEGKSQAAVGREYGVSRNTVYLIVHRHTWRHLAAANTD